MLLDSYASFAEATLWFIFVTGMIGVIVLALFEDWKNK